MNGVIPIFGEFGLANQLDCVEYSRHRRFRAMLEQWLDAIRAIWPQCPACTVANGQSIEISNATPVREYQENDQLRCDKCLGCCFLPTLINQAEIDTAVDQSATLGST